MRWWAPKQWWSNMLLFFLLYTRHLAGCQVDTVFGLISTSRLLEFACCDVLQCVTVWVRCSPGGAEGLNLTLILLQCVLHSHCSSSSSSVGRGFYVHHWSCAWLWHGALRAVWPSLRHSRGSCTFQGRSHEFFRPVGPLVIIICPGGSAAACCLFTQHWAVKETLL